MIRKLAILLPTLLFFGAVAIALSLDSEPHTKGPIAQDGIRLLSSDKDSVLVELALSDFRVEAFEHQGESYQRIVIDGLDRLTSQGDISLPTVGAMIGLPTTAGVRLELIETSFDTFDNYHLSRATASGLLVEGPVDSPADLVRDKNTLQQTPTTYGGLNLHPPAEIAYTGYLRDQAVAQVRFFPVQYDPHTRELRFYRRLVARFTWDRSTPDVTDQARPSSPAFEKLLRRTLLNYASLNRPTATSGPEAAIRPDLEMQSAATSTVALKIKVSVDGIYELTYGDLTGAGFPLSGASAIDPRTIKLTNFGNEVPIYIQGEGDGVFNLGDRLLFYGVAITDVYTVQNVYWLTAGGANGQRMVIKNGTPHGANVPPHFPATVRAEMNTYYWQDMPNGAGQDHWFWGNRLTAPTNMTYSVPLNNISSSASTATIRVRLKGRTDTPVNLDHHTRVYLNGIMRDDRFWDGMAVFDHQVYTVPHASLINGTNLVRVQGVGDTGASVDQFHVNWIEIDYWDSYVAEGNTLVFGAPAAGTYQFEISGFTGPSIELFEISDPLSVKLISNTVVLAGNQLQFQDASLDDTRYLAQAISQHRSPDSIEMDVASSWSSSANGADYIIITHEDFYTNSLPLANHRSAMGLRTVTVKVEDIYDEFNFGVFNPKAIRDFLTYAYNSWIAPAPTFVVLVGDAYQDYKDDLNTGTRNYVPSQIVETSLFGEVPSDNWYVLTSGNDLLPDMFIGRLSAETSGQVQSMVTNVINYEQSPPGAGWATKALLVADDDELIFENVSEQIADQLPFYYTPAKVYAGNYPPGINPTTDIIDAINAGTLLVNYAGHGATDRWGTWSGGQIFNRSNITSLTNSGKLPVVTIANCLNGFFTGPAAFASIAEVFQRQPNKGAVAIWAPSGLGYPPGHRALMLEFYDAIFQQDMYGLGEATTMAKLNVYALSDEWSELVETYVLFGDPAMELGIPANEPYVKSTLPADGATDVAIDQQVQVTFSKPMSTATVLLTGSGATVYTPTWNIDNTVVTFDHPDFTRGVTLTLSISGQDKLGQGLRSGTVPSSWSFAVTDQRQLYLPAIIKGG